MRYSLILTLTLITFFAKGQGPLHLIQADTISQLITPQLGIRFGTVAKIEAEIYDGDSLHTKVYMGAYLLKINSINGSKVSDTLLFRFTDETESLASNNFQLFKLITGKIATRLSSDEVFKMKKNYVGKKLTLMAYETGQFIGVPAGYFDYRPIRYYLGFHFEHSLVIISNATQ